MSIHPSLRGISKGVQQRSVLKRIERIRDLIEKGLWSDERSVFGLPKTKIVKLKIKKEKAVEKAETAATTVTPTPDTETTKKEPASKKESPAKKEPTQTK